MALIAVCAYKVLRSASQSQGLLSATPAGPPEAERVAAIVGTVVAVVAYVAKGADAIANGDSQLPAPPDWALWSVGGGHLSYLIGKAHRQRQQGE